MSDKYEPSETNGPSITPAPSRLSAQEFLACRFDLPESGQWSELEGGELCHLQPPDLDHGNAILNLSKAIAEVAHHCAGYACFDQGLLIARDPDTVWFPAMSYFVGGERFAEMDCEVTETLPALVVEMASTSDRRHRISERIDAYQTRGVAEVWVIDPHESRVEIWSSGRPSSVLQSGDCLEGGTILRNLRVTLNGLFSEPEWWS